MYGERLEDLGLLSLEEAQQDHISVHVNAWWEGIKSDPDLSYLYPVPGNGHKLKYRKFSVKIGKYIYS